jgi:adenylate kinase family enzyme
MTIIDSEALSSGVNEPALHLVTGGLCRPMYTTITKYRTNMGNNHNLLTDKPIYANGHSAMRRIIIIGSSGSGKSTLARQLGRILGHHVIHLDNHFWSAGWTPMPYSEWTACVREMVDLPSWIIDGNYRSTLDIRLQHADTVIFLDLPRLVCMWRAVKRRVQYAHISRPDIASGCDEQFFHPNLFNFLHRIWNYPQRARPDVLNRLANLHCGQQVFWLRSTAEVDQFLRAVQTSSQMLYSR